MVTLVTGFCKSNGILNLYEKLLAVKWEGKLQQLVLIYCLEQLEDY